MSIKIPSKEKIKQLHLKLSKSNPKLFDLVWTHSLIVADLAESIVNNQNLFKGDKTLVRIGCLVHDIGVYQCNLHKKEGIPYIKHGILGFEILLNAGYSPEIAQFARNHTCITSEDIIRQNLPLPVDEYVPVTTEQEIVSYADMFHSKKPKLKQPEDVTSDIEKFGMHKVERFKRLMQQYGVPDLANISEKYREWHLSFNK